MKNKIKIQINSDIYEILSKVVNDVLIPYYNGEELENYEALADIAIPQDPIAADLRCTVFGDGDGASFVYEAIAYDDPLSIGTLRYFIHGDCITCFISRDNHGITLEISNGIRAAEFFYKEIRKTAEEKAKELELEDDLTNIPEEMEKFKVLLPKPAKQ